MPTRYKPTILNDSQKEAVLNLTYGTPFYDQISGLWKQEIRLEDARAYPPHPSDVKEKI